MTPLQILIKTVKLFFTLILGFFFLSIFLVIFTSNLISKSINKPSNYLIKAVFNAVKNNPYQSKDKINFLILGLDKRDDALEKTTTTDTIIFASLNLKTLKLSLVSTPRDLWFNEKLTKINGLYPLSLESGQNPFDFLKLNFSKLYGQPIDHVVIITTDNLINFVNLIGGVDLYLDKGFVDNQYPNPEYIKNPSSKIPIYKTVEFPSGQIYLDQSNITEFVRSRKSTGSVTDGGTDIGRINRQQLLIEAILTKIKSKNFINNQDQLKSFYSFWDQQIYKTISDTDVLQIILKLDGDINNLSTSKIDIPIGKNYTDGIIYHPDSFINNQWVFLTGDDQYQGFQEFIKKSI